jgi:hypothetical protein
MFMSVFWHSECFVKIVRFRFGNVLKRSKSKMTYSGFLIEELHGNLPHISGVGFSTKSGFLIGRKLWVVICAPYRQLQT